MFRGIKWVFFDVGSTLVDESAAYDARIRKIAAAAGQSSESVYETALEFYRRNQKGDREAARVFGTAVPVWQKELETPYPDAVQCLRELHSRYKIGIIANQPPGTEERLRGYGFLPHIDLVISSAEEGVAKPEPDIFELALRRSGCRPEEAVMIGDRIDNDILPAKTLGMHTIRIRQGFGRFRNITSDAEKADCTVDCLTELCTIL